MSDSDSPSPVSTSTVCRPWAGTSPGGWAGVRSKRAAWRGTRTGLTSGSTRSTSDWLWRTWGCWCTSASGTTSATATSWSPSRASASAVVMPASAPGHQSDERRHVPAPVEHVGEAFVHEPLRMPAGPAQPLNEPGMIGYRASAPSRVG